jgi:hypothetical protein
LKVVTKQVTSSNSIFKEARTVALKKPVILAALIFFARATSCEAAVLTCIVNQKVQCQAGVECLSLKPTITVKIDWDYNTYSHCDANGCDDYHMNPTQSGEYIVVDVPGRGTFAKLKNAGGDFVEVVSIAGQVLVNFGKRVTSAQ